MACIVLFAFAARNIPFKQIAKHTIFISEVLLAFVILCAFSDIIPNYVRETNGRTRYYLGFCMHCIRLQSCLISLHYLYTAKRETEN